MKKTTNKGNRYFTWVLRILLSLMIVNWALFSIDVFQKEQGFWNILVGFLMKNIPVFVMIFILIIAWKRENIGGMLLMLGVLGFTIFVIALSGQMLSGTLITNYILHIYFLGIPFLIGALFVVNHYLLGKK